MSRTIHFADKGVRARTAASEPGVLARLREIVGGENVLVDEERVEPYAGDALKEKFPPEAVVLPRTANEVSAILRLANERRFPVTARGGGVGYTGGGSGGGRHRHRHRPHEPHPRGERREPLRDNRAGRDDLRAATGRRRGRALLP